MPQPKRINRRRWSGAKKIFDTGTDTQRKRSAALSADLPGNLDQVALDQQVQSIDDYVGRLAFDDLEHYRSYAEKVLRYENGAQQSEPVGLPSSLFTMVQKPQRQDIALW